MPSYFFRSLGLGWIPTQSCLVSFFSLRRYFCVNSLTQTYKTMKNEKENLFRLVKSEGKIQLAEVLPPFDAPDFNREKFNVNEFFAAYSQWLIEALKFRMKLCKELLEFAANHDQIIGQTDHAIWYVDGHFSFRAYNDMQEMIDMLVEGSVSKATPTQWIQLLKAIAMFPEGGTAKVREIVADIALEEIICDPRRAGN